MLLLLIRFFSVLLCCSLLLTACDSSGWSNPPDNYNPSIDDDDSDTGDDDDSDAGDDDDSDAGDDDDSDAGDDDTSADDDDTSADDDDTSADDDDSDAGDDDTSADDDDSAGDDDDSDAGDDDDSDAGDDDDSTPVITDADGDGYGAATAGGDDCDDSDPAVHPGASEDPTNAIDDDCDSQVDEPMSVTGFSPTDGLVLGGTLVTITGSGMNGVTEVQFGTSSATSVTVIDDSTVEVVSPAGTLGDVDVVVSSAFETVTLAVNDEAGYRYTDECTAQPDCLDLARLHSQQEISTTPGVQSGSFSALISDTSLADCTTRPDGVIAQVGLGQQGSNPVPTQDPNWRWFPASFDAALSSASECAYSGAITHDSYGSFWVTFRFSDDDGYLWVYADSDESTALDYLEMSQLHVTP